MPKKLNIAVTEAQLKALTDFAKSQGLTLREVSENMVRYYTENTIPYIEALDKQVDLESSKMVDKVWATTAQ